MILALKLGLSYVDLNALFIRENVCIASAKTKSTTLTALTMISSCLKKMRTRELCSR